MASWDVYHQLVQDFAPIHSRKHFYPVGRPGHPSNHRVDVSNRLLWRRKLGMSPQRCERRVWPRCEKKKKRGQDMFEGFKKGRFCDNYFLYIPIYSFLDNVFLFKHVSILFTWYIYIRNMYINIKTRMHLRKHVCLFFFRILELVQEKHK